MSWSFAASTPIIVIGLLIWLAAAALLIVHARRNGGRKAVLRLEGMRFIIVTLLVFTLLRPEFVQQIPRTEKPVVAVLCDSSGSMQTRDVAMTNRIVTRGEWLEAQKQREFWKPLEKSARVAVRNIAFAVDAANQETDLNRALEETLRRERNLKAVLLLSDGDWNAGQSPVVAATRFREQEIPILAAAVGRETPLPDLELASVTAPAYGLFGEQIVIGFKIRSTLPSEVRTTVTLTEPSGEETQREILIPANGEFQDAIVWSPHSVGETTLALQLPVEKEETIPENNRKEVRINIRSEKLKVLVVDSLPRWEYRYLRNALERDPGVDMHCILFHPGIAMGGGRGYLSTFPNSKEALAQYDVIFLGDVGIGQGELAAQDAERIKGLIEQQASGLVFIPGSRGRQLTLLDTPLGDLMPVVLDKSKAEGVGLQNESNLLLSSAGKRHWLTRFDADEDRNEEMWKQLPGFAWSASVEKARPGSEVLAVHSALRNEWGRVPLLVTRMAGGGKILFMGSDSAWRWRRGVEDKFHYRFWSQVVRWMAHQRHLSENEGVRLTYSPEKPEVGDTLFLQAMSDAMETDTRTEPLVARITSPSQRAEQLAFSALEGGWGVSQASFVPQEGGKYKVQFMTAQGRPFETEISVEQPQREKIGKPINASVLAEIANITRGKAAPYESLDELVNAIALLPEQKPIERRIRLWSSPWWGGGILSLLAIYWIGRKLAGMV